MLIVCTWWTDQAIVTSIDSIAECADDRVVGEEMSLPAISRAALEDGDGEDGVWVSEQMILFSRLALTTNGRVFAELALVVYVLVLLEPVSYRPRGLEEDVPGLLARGMAGEGDLCLSERASNGTFSSLESSLLLTK